jgi:hypothetical protein
MTSQGSLKPALGFIDRLRRSGSSCRRSSVGELSLTPGLSIKGVGLSELPKKVPFGATWYSLFNDKFKAARTSDEFKSQYEEILRYSDPTIPDEDKPEWAKHSEFEKFGIMISGMRGSRVNVGTGPWTQEQDDVLRERRAEKVPWKDISAEIEQIFGVRRTTKALQGRFDSAVRKQHPEDTSLRSKVRWTEEQMNWAQR